MLDWLLSDKQIVPTDQRRSTVLQQVGQHASCGVRNVIVRSRGMVDAVVSTPRSAAFQVDTLPCQARKIEQPDAPAIQCRQELPVNRAFVLFADLVSDAVA